MHERNLAWPVDWANMQITDPAQWLHVGLLRSWVWPVDRDLIKTHQPVRFATGLI